MKNNKQKMIYILLICFVLTGCQRETQVPPEIEDQTAGTDNMAATVDKEDEVSANAMEDEDISEERMTVISILGEEDLEIESDMIHNFAYNPQQQMDGTTAKQIDTILSTIEGTWGIDKYVGFVSYDTYKESQLIKGGTEEVIREKYEKSKGQAATNVPDIFFFVNDHSATSEENNNRCIYVSDGHAIYESPISINISIRKTGDDYSTSVNRTIKGVETSPKYPIIYIEFFSFFYSEAEEKVVYEPETFILASDGQFLLLRDGAFYTLKNSIRGEIISGNFSHLDNEDWKDYEESYHWQKEKGYKWIGDCEWILADINKDGEEDLVLQGTDYDEGRIIAIIACQDDWAKCVYWDQVDSTAYSFYTPTGKLIYYYFGSSTWLGVESYEHYYYDENWNKIIDYELIRYNISNDFKEYDDSKEWLEKHHGIYGAGNYYYRIDHTSKGDKEELLTYEQFINILETETGIIYQE